MKKLLLLGLVLGSFLTAKAQTVSFEAAEGFTLGDIDTQNEWTTNAADVAQVSDTYATDGVNSLLIEGLDGAHTSLLGTFSPNFTATGTTITVAFDVYITDISETASDFFVTPQSLTEELITSRIRFTYEGLITVVDTDPDDPAALIYTDTGATFEVATWYNVKMVHLFDTAQIEYYIDDVLIYTGDAFGAQSVENITFLNDNYASSAYFDNVQVVEGLLGVDQHAATQFSVSPNPASSLITIANAENINVNAISITDMNGRVVKQNTFSGLSNVEVNVSDLASGVYMVSVSSDNGTTTKKLVKN